MSRKEKTLRETIEEVYDEIVNYANEFANESDRAAAVLAAALFEESLREAIVKRFVEVDKKTADHFNIYQPIYSFRDKINIAFLLGLYDQEILKGLHTVLTIRNKFAHRPKPLFFCSKEVADLCRNLDTRTTLDPNEFRERYMHYLREVESDIQSNLTHAVVAKRKE